MQNNSENQRVIKFRAWDGECMVILENSGLQYFDFEGSYSLGFTVDAYSEFWAHEQYGEPTGKAMKFPIMQFTGLHDKHGKEIFEGDIIGNEKHFHVIEYRPEYACFIAKWLNIEDPTTTNGISQKWLIEQEKEVIGNIYENPELLEVPDASSGGNK